MAHRAAAAQGRLGALVTLHMRPPLRRIQAAWAGSFAGEAIAAIAFGVLAYRSAGATGVAFLVAVQLLPTAVLAPILGAAGSRFRRERLALAVDFGRTAVAAAAAVLSASGAPREALFALAAVLTVGTAVSNPPRRALLPLLVAAPRELTTAGIASASSRQLPRRPGRCSRRSSSASRAQRRCSRPRPCVSRARRSPKRDCRTRATSRPARGRRKPRIVGRVAPRARPRLGRNPLGARSCASSPSCSQRRTSAAAR